MRLMRAFRSSKNLRVVMVLGGLALAGLVLAGCEGIPTKGERAARQDLKTVGDAYRPQHQRPSMPTLQTNASLSNFLYFAIMNQPQVEAAYYEWAASVERITR